MRPILLFLPEWLGGFPVPSYGLMLLLGPIAAAFLFRMLAGRAGAPRSAAFELILETTLVGVLAGKIGGLFLLPEGTVLTLRVVAGSGGVWYIGFVCGFTYFCLRVRPLGLTCADAVDRLLPSVALGHAFGRIGCLLAGCCFGGECGLPWAVTFTDQAASRAGVPLGVPLHPTQAYEAIVELALCAALSWRVLRGRRFAGEVALLYLLLYAAARFTLEMFRADYRGSLGALSTSQTFAVVIAAVTLPLLIFGWMRGGLGALAEWPPPGGKDVAPART